MDATRYYYLGIIDRKCRRYPKIFRDIHAHADFYPDYASMIVMAKGSDATRFVNCHNAEKEKTTSHSCCDRWLCPYCAYTNRQNYRRKFSCINLHGSSRYYHLIFSLKASIVHQEAAVEPYLAVWNGAKDLLNSMRHSGLIQGYLTSEEMHVEFPYPDILLLPHTHSIISSTLEIQEANIEKLWNDVLARVDVGLGLRGSVKLVPIGDSAQMSNTIQYLFKPIRLLKPYTDALAGMGKSRVWELNRNVVEYLNLLDVIRLENGSVAPKKNSAATVSRSSRHLVYSSGCFFSTSKNYIGVKQVKRQK